MTRSEACAINWDHEAAYLSILPGKIKASASVCRFCRRDLPTLYDRRRSRSMGWLPVLAVAAIIVGGSAFLASEFLKERENWLER